jgi:hypothetical protein
VLRNREPGAGQCPYDVYQVDEEQPTAWFQHAANRGGTPRPHASGQVVQHQRAQDDIEASIRDSARPFVPNVCQPGRAETTMAQRRRGTDRRIRKTDARRRRRSIHLLRTFRDKNDLLTSSIHDALQSIRSNAAAANPLAWFSLPIFEHIHRRRLLFRALVLPVFAA